MRLRLLNRMGFLGILGGMLVLSAFGADHYVRTTAQGSDNGADWSNAWSITSLNWGSVASGDNIWMAGGNYSASMTISASGTLGSDVSIRRVRSTNSVPAAAAGWSAGFDSTVEMTGITLGNNVAYVDISGQVLNGIKITGTGPCLHEATTGNRGIHFRYIEVVGPGTSSTNPDGLAMFHPNLTTPTDAPFIDSSFEYCWFHDHVILIFAAGWSNSVVDHCFFYNSLPNQSNPVQHPDAIYSQSMVDCAIRFNVVSNCAPEAFWNTASWNALNTYNLSYYGNVFTGPVMTSDNRMAITFAGLWAPYPMIYGNIYIYNNTFNGYTEPVGFENVEGTAGAGSYVANNLFYNCGDNVYDFAITHDYNWFSDGSSHEEAHSIAGSGDPFSAIPILSGTTGPTSPRNNGVNLGTGYNTDIYGNTRGADGGWDIGAAEYQGENTNAVMVLSSTYINFGTVTNGDSVTNSLWITNIGSASLVGTCSVPAGQFSIVSTATYNLASNDVAEIEFKYSPFSDTDNDTATATGTNIASQTIALVGHIYSSPALLGLSFSAIHGTVTYPMVANLGGYISQGIETLNTNGGSAVYWFNVTNVGNYSLLCWGTASGQGANSFFVDVDSWPTTNAIFDMPEGSSNALVSWRGSSTGYTYEAAQYLPKVWSNLSAGQHELIVLGREAAAVASNWTFAIYPPVTPAVATGSAMSPRARMILLQ